MCVCVFLLLVCHLSPLPRKKVTVTLRFSIVDLIMVMALMMTKDADVNDACDKHAGDALWSAARPSSSSAGSTSGRSSSNRSSRRRRNSSISSSSSSRSSSSSSSSSRVVVE